MQEILISGYVAQGFRFFSRTKIIRFAPYFQRGSIFFLLQIKRFPPEYSIQIIRLLRFFLCPPLNLVNFQIYGGGNPHGKTYQFSKVMGGRGITQGTTYPKGIPIRLYLRPTDSIMYFPRLQPATPPL